MSTNLDNALAELAELALLENNWDDEGAPPPTGESIRNAEAVLRWAVEQGLVVTAVDGDVCGGASLMLDRGDLRREAWAYCSNGGENLITLIAHDDGAASVRCSDTGAVFVSLVPVDDSPIRTLYWGDDAKRQTIEFLA